MAHKDQEDLIVFINKLRELMMDRNHSSRKLALRLGLTQPQVSRLRRRGDGQNWNPAGETLIRIAALLGKKIVLVPDKD